MTPKVTLVFPCWHAAQHMPHVLEDLQAQTFKDFEAILVNDGDESQVEAMEQIAAQDRRIRIVHRQQNGGVAAARNSGTDVVTTPWVTYPDSDDRFGPNYVQSLYEAVDGTEVELVCGGYTVLHVNTGKYEHHYFDINKTPLVVDMVDGYEQIFLNWSVANTWNKLYSMSIISNHNLKHDINFLNGQDLIFNLTYFPLVKRVGLVGNCDYLYYYSKYNTNWSRYNPNWMKNHLQMIELQEQLHRQIGWSEQRITEYKDRIIVYNSLGMLKNLYAINSPLTVSKAAKKIREELVDDERLVNVLMKKDFRNDRIMRLVQRLVGKGYVWQLALIFKLLCIGKRHFGTLYAKVKPFFRGE